VVEELRWFNSHQSAPPDSAYHGVHRVHHSLLLMDGLVLWSFRAQETELAQGGSFRFRKVFLWRLPARRAAAGLANCKPPRRAAAGLPHKENARS
jgi:hypothetical protein